MSKSSLTIDERASIYAAWKALETYAKPADGTCELPPDTRKVVGGKTVTVTIPDGWTVERAAGENGEGTVQKAATQNSYGFGVFLALLDRATRFNQEGVVMDLIIGSMQDAVNDRCPTQEAMLRRHPEVTQRLLERVDEIRESMPKRTEPTPRSIDKPNRKRATVTIN